ncbi:MAG: RagB/SusD family nutrient uptake outer membrane protein [Paludibacteraceae bacterium]|nr:RagB/SusD family nutrient uptake outer membrane protein [Paludibacteraceae bacterium]
MKSNTHISALVSLYLVALPLTLFSCKDYLTENAPGTVLLEDFFVSGGAAEQCVTGCYTPMIWEYNTTYFPEWFIGDVVSDDALKGGQNTMDMEQVYDMENWQTEPSNSYIFDHYKTPYQGIARCNLALKYIEPMTTDSTMDERTKQRYLGEIHFMRAYYYFHLLRIFGGVPLTLQVENDAERWELPRNSVEEVCNQIISDLKYAQERLWLKSEYDTKDAGRATKGAAQGMLQKVYLYMASPYWHDKHLTSLDRQELYRQSKAWGDSIILSGEYNLVSDYEFNFSLAGENNQESVFELQYMEVPWGDYGDANGGHNGYTAGSFSQILMRSRSTQIGGGWGFSHPTWNLYNEFESGDPRRDVAIFTPDPAMMDNVLEETYCGTAMLNNKYGMYRETSDSKAGIGPWGYHASRGPLNRAYMRYADNLLMYAEACLYLGDEATAKQYIDMVRTRVGMPAAGTNPISVNGVTISSPTTEQLLRHERRMELAMEGHRWFDLVRWGGTKAHMEAYQATESDAARSHLATFVEGKHELFPIPQKEIELNPALTQNPGYN